MYLDTIQKAFTTFYSGIRRKPFSTHVRDIWCTLFVTNLMARWRESATDIIGPVRPKLWTVNKMNAAKEQKEFKYNNGKYDDIFDPGMCQTDLGRDEWQIAFVDKLNTTVGAAKVTVNYIEYPSWDDHDKLVFLDDDKMRHYQMLLTGENFKCDNKLVDQMLKSACEKKNRKN